MPSAEVAYIHSSNAKNWIYITTHVDGFILDGFAETKAGQGTHSLTTVFPFISYDISAHIYERNKNVTLTMRLLPGAEVVTLNYRSTTKM